MDITEKQVFDYIFPLKRAGLANEELVPYIEQFIELFDGAICTKRVKELVVKAGEVYDRESGNINIAEAVREFVMTTNGFFSTTDVYNALHVTTRKDKKTVVVALLRLAKQGVIERSGNRNGQYRLIDTETVIIDPKKSLGEEFDILLPLGLNEYVKIFPKNLIVFAGVSNTGKTAIALNTVALNLDRFKGKIRYLSSEMGECELQTRLNKFGLPLDVWDGCEFHEKSDYFSDKIEPDSINIIDYYEVCKDYSEIADGFKSIYKKLNKGIAIIAIQKSPGVEYGRGASFSTEKPRLYVTLDEDTNDKTVTIAKIVKAKNWRGEKNPNKIWKRFKIDDGYKINELSVWLEPKKEENEKKRFY